MRLIKRLFTKNKKAIPLYFVTFDYRKYKKFGKEKSCEAVVHPLLSGDEELKKMINDTIDYIRDKYNMEDM
jgi:hypothetical protein